MIIEALVGTAMLFVAHGTGFNKRVIEPRMKELGTRGYIEGFFYYAVFIGVGIVICHSIANYKK
jgi:hypothetical protein